jgi:hypothetical protein
MSGPFALWKDLQPVNPTRTYIKPFSYYFVGRQWLPWINNISGYWIGCEIGQLRTNDIHGFRLEL